MSNPTLLVLAAGMGTRRGGQRIGEPVGPNGEAVVDYSVYDAHRAGFGRVVFVTRGSIEQHLKDVVNARIGKHISVEYLRQEVTALPPGFRVPARREKPWGTAHAVLIAANTIHEPFAVINVEDFYGAGSYRAVASHLKSGTSDFAMAGYVLRNTLSEFGAVARGVCTVSPQGYLENLIELKNVERDGGHARSSDEAGKEMRLSGGEVVSMNMWGFTPQVFAPLRAVFEKFLKRNGWDLNGEYFLPIAIDELVSSGQVRVKVLQSGETWFGVTYPEDHTYAADRIRRLIEQGIYPRRLW